MNFSTEAACLEHESDRPNQAIKIRIKSVGFETAVRIVLGNIGVPKGIIHCTLAHRSLIRELDILSPEGQLSRMIWG